MVLSAIARSSRWGAPLFGRRLLDHLRRADLVGAPGETLVESRDGEVEMGGHVVQGQGVETTSGTAKSGAERS